MIFFVIAALLVILDQATKFYIRETALSVKSELVMITYGAKETVVVNIFGVFDLRQVARLSSIRPK